MDNTSKENNSINPCEHLSGHKKEQTNANNMTPNIKIPRTRNESVSSDENLSVNTNCNSNGNTNSNSNDGKRQKPECGEREVPSSPIALTMFPNGIPPSPPKFVSLEEIMKAANGVENMVLAHEIAVDNQFKLEKVEAPRNSLENTIKEVLHKAFWDILESQLNESPTNYKQAMVLLKEIKGNLLSLLLPQHIRLQQEIEEIIDLDLILQQAENGILDFQRYAQYILSVCARLCAPVRDETIRELTQKSEIVPLFRGIIELLDAMRLDMANFHIQQMRPHIQLKSIQYERQKFQEFLDSQSKLSTADGLEYTKIWLKRNNEMIDLSNETNSRIIINKLLINSYLELLVWDNSKQEYYPETLLLDSTRINSIKAKVTKLTLIGSLFFVTFATVGTSIQDIQEFKEKLKDQLMLLLSEDSDSSEDLKSQMTSIALQVIKEVQNCLEKHGFPHLDSNKTQILETQIIDISNANNRVKKVVERRILEFIERVLSSPTAAPMQIPTGLSSLQKELTEIAGQFMRIVAHNRAVFSKYYANIIIDMIPNISSSERESLERDLTISSQ